MKDLNNIQSLKQSNLDIIFKDGAEIQASAQTGLLKKICSARFDVI